MITKISELQEEFERRFLDDLDECRSLGYDPTYLLDMVKKYGAIEASKRLLRGRTQPYGFTKLCKMGQTKMTIEAFLYENPKFHPLFSDKLLANCMDRLKSVGYIKG